MCSTTEGSCELQAGAESGASDRCSSTKSQSILKACGFIRVLWGLFVKRSHSISPLSPPVHGIMELWKRDRGVLPVEQLAGS